MQKLAFLVLIVFFPVLAMAQGNVEERLHALEKSHDELSQVFGQYNAEIYHTLKEKKEAGLASMFAGRFSLSGLLEFEASYEAIDMEGGDSASSSDLTLATAQLGLGAMVNENVSGNLTLLYEEDATDLEVDEAVITLTFGPWSARLGQQYLPFGVYLSHFVSDPLTLQLGETRETAAVFSYEKGNYSISIFLFNGDTEKTNESENHGRDWGLGLTVTPVEGVEVGASYLSDLSESDAEFLTAYTDRVAGWSAYGVVEINAFAFSIEALGATESFDGADLDEDNDGNGDKPFVWDVELAWYPKENLEFALRVEGSDEFSGQPELQYGLVTSYGAWEDVSLSLEYLHGEFDDFGFDEDGNIMDSRDLVTAQLAVEF